MASDSRRGEAILHGAKLVPALNSMLGFLSKDLTVLSIPRHHTPRSMYFMMSFHIVHFNY
jgi:hypothetical protein